MELHIATQDQEIDYIHSLYVRAFPFVEQKPFRDILDLQARGICDLYIITHEGAHCGLAVVHTVKDTALLDYFAIDEKFRGMGLGGMALDALTAHYSDRYSGDALVNKVRLNVNVPGTSEYQSGLAFRVDRYLRGDAEFNDAKFQTTPHSDWLVENSWKYGFVFRFPVEGYPNATVEDRAYKTGESKKLSVYRYVGQGNAAVMHAMNFCMEEYIEYLVKHPHIALYENGVLKYEVVRQDYNGGASAEAEVARSAKDYTVSMDNMGGVIVCMSY